MRNTVLDIKNCNDALKLAELVRELDERGCLCDPCVDRQRAVIDRLIEVLTLQKPLTDRIVGMSGDDLQACARAVRIARLVLMGKNEEALAEARGLKKLRRTRSCKR